MIITSYLSNKLKVLSFVLISMVVLLHAQIINLSPKGISVFVQRLFSGEITRIAVSFFFIISGFLFSYNIDDNNFCKLFYGKIKKRVYSLLIPYLLWSVICLATVTLMQLLNISTIGAVKPISTYGITDFYDEIIAKPKIAYQLWFIRDLFIVSVISPIIYYCLRYFKELVIIAVVAVWFNWWHIGFLSITSITFFTIGMYLAMYRKDWVYYRFKSKLWWLLPITWLGFCIVMVYIDYDSLLILFIDKLLGILSLWVAYDLLGEYKRQKILSIEALSFSFIVYLIHEPLLTLCKQIYIHIVGVDGIAISLLFYFTCPIVIITLCIFIGRSLKTYFPNIYQMLTGGR